ncbi:MAG: hypothetical protein M3Q07_25455 [Pseudobdellovibrionaceae bacterium]|nr:hypothetical protein [Pseudobdellovibrionaceae bacterium]
MIAKCGLSYHFSLLFEISCFLESVLHAFKEIQWLDRTQHEIEGSAPERLDRHFAAWVSRIW